MDKVSYFHAIYVTTNRENLGKGSKMNILNKVDFEYEEVLDVKIQGLIRAACAVAVGCPS